MAVVCWQLTCSPAFAELANDQAIFVDFNGIACGIVSAESMSIVSEFACDRYSEGIDVTSDGARAVISNSRGEEKLTLFDLTKNPPEVIGQIDLVVQGVPVVQGVKELDIAPDDSFGIATGSMDGRTVKFTLEPFKIVGTSDPWYPDTVYYLGGNPQDVHINSSGTLAVQPMFRGDYFAVVDVTDAIPELQDEIPTPAHPVYTDTFLNHRGISLSQWDDDTFVATGSPWHRYVTVGSLSGTLETVVFDAQGFPESADITCDGTRAVVETSAGLMWIALDRETPVLLSFFGTDAPRIDYYSTSTVAFSADGSLLFVGGGNQIDIYDVYPDLPELRGSITIDGRNIYSVATLPCSAAPSEIEVAVDIKPRTCPNRLYVKSKGVLKVAILGSEDFDVTLVDPRTIQIDGVSPFNWKLKDAATPYDSDDMQGDCSDCTRKGRDGFLDLELKFKNKDIARVVGAANHGDCLVLTLSGKTFDGQDILGDDVVRISTKKKNGKEWFKKFFLSLLKAHKKDKRNNSCTIEKKKTSLISKIKSRWHRFDKRH
jgi:hypothetical protein